MAEKTLNTRLQLKYDTLENWSKTTAEGKGANLVLKQGEMAICYVPGVTSGTTQVAPTVLMKVGDGSSTFAALPWASGNAADVYTWAKAATKPSYAYSEITDKPTLFSGSYNDLTNKPTIPTNTNTTYQLVQDSSDGHKFTLQSKNIGDSSWSDVTAITIPDSDVNQTIKVGSTTFGSNDAVALVAGSNVTITPDSSGKTITITSTDTNTTYTVATGTENGKIKVTPSSGSAYEVPVYGLGSAAYTASTDYATAAQGIAADAAMPKSGGTFTGAVTLSGAPTNNLHPATKKYVDDKVSGLVDSAPAALDTLNELAAALGDDANFSTTVANQIGTKVDKVEGKGLSTEDYTSDEKTKLAGIAAGATANTGTVTSVAVKMNGSTKGTITSSGTIDLGTVITEHQDISGKADASHTHSEYAAADHTHSGYAASSHTHGQGDITQSSGDVLVLNCGSSTTNV